MTAIQAELVLQKVTSLFTGNWHPPSIIRWNLFCQSVNYTCVDLYHQTNDPVIQYSVRCFRNMLCDYFITPLFRNEMIWSVVTIFELKASSDEVGDLMCVIWHNIQKYWSWRLELNMIYKKSRGPSGPRLPDGGPSGLFTSSFAPFGRSGRVTQAKVT